MEKKFLFIFVSLKLSYSSAFQHSLAFNSHSKQPQTLTFRVSKFIFQRLANMHYSK